MPSYLIKIIRISGKGESGLRHTELTSIEEIQKIVREKLRKAGKIDTLAFIQVTLSTKPAEKNL
jgi:hypothetical protein